MRINIYSEINEELLEDLSEQLEMDCDKLEIHINSAGGSVLAGLKVISMIHSKGVPTECYIEFLAASMAADIAMTCDKVYMNKYGLLMFHNAWSPNEDLTDSQNEYLAKQSEMMCKMVAEKRGIDLATFAEYCNTEKWFTAEEALSINLIDGIDDTMSDFAEYKDEVMELYSNKHFSTNMEGIFDVCKKLNTIKMDVNKEAIDTTIETPIETIETIETENVNELEANKEVDTDNIDTDTELEVNKGMKPMKEDEMDDEEDSDKEDLVMECDKLRKEVEMLKGELTKYKEKEAMAKKEALYIEINKVLDEAIKEGKITDKEDWSPLLEGDFNKFSTIIKKLPTNNKKSFDVLTNVIGKSVNNNERDNWTYKDWSKKDPNGLLKLLKENKSEYSRLFKDYFGTEYKG